MQNFTNTVEYGSSSWFEIGTLVLTSLTLLVNLHQSYSHDHYSSCFDKECFMFSRNQENPE